MPIHWICKLFGHKFIPITTACNFVPAIDSIVCERCGSAEALNNHCHLITVKT